VIQDAVRSYFQQDPRADVDPDEVVAMGAAIHAASLVNEEVPDSVLLDVTPIDLRIGVVGGLAESIIESNTPVPIEQTRRFTTSSDYQESVVIRVYQGGQREAGGNELLGQFEFRGFAPAPRGEVSIDVTFEIDVDGIVQVTAADPDTGKTTSTTLTLTSGLSGKDLEDIVATNRMARVSSSHRPTNPVEDGTDPSALPGPTAADEPVASASEPGAPEAADPTEPDDSLSDTTPIELAAPEEADGTNP
ncbi:MAG: Hsp70 family protein, partial [Myxococcota bacterium]